MAYNHPLTLGSLSAAESQGMNISAMEMIDWQVEIIVCIESSFAGGGIGGVDLKSKRAKWALLKAPMDKKPYFCAARGVLTNRDQTKCEFFEF